MKELDLSAAWQRLVREAAPLDAERIEPLRPAQTSDSRWSSYLTTVVCPMCELVRRLEPGIVGISGPPGSGKSTLARVLAGVLPSSAILSLDDFYLSRAERQRRRLRWRGSPGSHDLRLLIDVLEKIRSKRAPLTVPRFSAAVDDRAEAETLSAVPDIVFLEGWFLGYPDEGYGEVLRFVDVLVFLDVDIPTAKHRRFQREETLRAAGGGFSVDETAAFWDEVLGPGIETLVPKAKQNADLVIEIDSDERARRVTSRDERLVSLLG